VELREGYTETQNARDLRSLLPGFRGFNGGWDTFKFGNVTAGQLYDFFSNYSRYYERHINASQAYHKYGPTQGPW
jgi:hypothetical protein